MNIRIQTEHQEIKMTINITLGYFLPFKKYEVCIESITTTCAESPTHKWSIVNICIIMKLAVTRPLHHSYISMSENILCIAANHETTHSRELLLHFSHPTIVMTLCPRYTAGHSMPPTLHNSTLPVVYSMHPPVFSASQYRHWNDHYCSPSPVYGQLQ